MGTHREVKAFNARVRKLTKTITHADLTAAVNGTAQAIEIGTLPPGAVLTGKAYKLTTQFTGGSASSVGMTLGDTDDVDRILTTADVLGGTAGAFVNGTAGVAAGPFAAATVVNATFTPDGAHTLLGLTAGSVTVEIYFAVPDSAV